MHISAAEMYKYNCLHKELFSTRCNQDSELLLDNIYYFSPSNITVLNILLTGTV